MHAYNPMSLHAALHHLAGVNANIDCGTVDLFPCYSLNVNNPLFPVDCYNLAFSALQIMQ